MRRDWDSGQSGSSFCLATSRQTRGHLRGTHKKMISLFLLIDFLDHDYTDIANGSDFRQYLENLSVMIVKKESGSI